ncbi:MAG: antitoxin VbhA family protein [Candidatus Accumulibacter sp.]|jgi:hypothetical protein|nr:antitoxin VbhA family protein [Accumulibacter sp.]
MDAVAISNIEETTVKNTPVKPALSATERLARRKAVDFARANVALEGFNVSTPEYEALVERYASGELDMNEFLAIQGLKPSVYRI